MSHTEGKKSKCYKDKGKTVKLAQKPRTHGSEYSQSQEGKLEKKGTIIWA